MLKLGGPQLRRAILHLKENGVKTEPAFAQYLKLEGNPYELVLKLDELSEDELKILLKASQE